MIINTHRNLLLSDENIASIERAYDAEFVCTSTIKGKDGWVNKPAAIFYNANPPLTFSPHFAVVFQMGDPVITCGDSALETFSGILLNGEVHYSAYRHHGFTIPDTDVMVDGGRDYLSISGPQDFEIVCLQIIENKLTVVDNQD